MKRKVTYAKFHDLTVNVPGVGLIQGGHLPLANKTLPGLTMTYTEHGLLVGVLNHELLIPAANIQVVTFAPEEVSTPVRAVKAS